MGLAARFNTAQQPACGPSQQQGPPPQGYGQQQPGYPPQPQGGYYPPVGQQGYPPQQQGGYYPPVGPGQQGYGAPQPGVPPQQQGGYYPPQGGFPSQPQGGYPQQGGFPPPQQQQQQQQGGDLSGLLRTKLTKMVAVNKLQAFYPPQKLESVLQHLARVDFRRLASQWQMNLELAIDLASLALYDIIIYADDSTSMKYADNGERIEDLKVILEKVSEVVVLFDDDGISIRAMNHPAKGDNIKSAKDAQAFVKNLRFSGMTPLGTEMERRILDPFLYQRLRANSLQKPLLVITITDGEPTNEPDHKIHQVIKKAKQACMKTPFGPGAVAFEFAQVGKDQGAQEFLGKLDTDKEVGAMVDATSYFELEQQEYAKRGVQLTPELWLVKLLCGAIDPEYDEQDE